MEEEAYPNYYEFNPPENLSPCFYSSTLYLTNAVSAFYFKYYIYSALFVVLVLTSLLYHWSKNIYALYLDKIPIVAIVLYGGYIFYQKLRNSEEIPIPYVVGIISSVLITIYLYYYGYVTQEYCYNKNFSLAEKYHSFLHLISCIGLNLIVFMP
jgi:hypothetical protein